jgi:hypothetical protein
VQVIALLDGHYTAFPGDVLGQAQQAHDCGSDVYLRPSAAQVEFFYTRAGKDERHAQGFQPRGVFGRGVPALAFLRRKDHAVIRSDHKERAISAAGFSQVSQRRVQGFYDLQILLRPEFVGGAVGCSHIDKEKEGPAIQMLH